MGEVEKSYQWARVEVIKKKKKKKKNNAFRRGPPQMCQANCFCKARAKEKKKKKKFQTRKRDKYCAEQLSPGERTTVTSIKAQDASVGERDKTRKELWM